MRLDVFLHFPERFYQMANADLQAQIDRATKTITDQAAQIKTLTAANADLTAKLAGADNAEDEVDATALGAALDAAGAEPIPPATPAALSIDVSGFPTSIAVGAAETVSLVAEGGEGPYTFSATGLPDGLTLDGAVVSGAATTPGTFSVSVGVVDSAGNTASANVTVVVA